MAQPSALPPGERKQQAGAAKQEAEREGAPVVPADQEEARIAGEEQTRDERDPGSEGAPRECNADQEPEDAPGERRQAQDGEIAPAEREARNQKLALESSHVGLRHPGEGAALEAEDFGAGKRRGSGSSLQKLQARQCLDHLVVVGTRHAEVSDSQENHQEAQAEPDCADGPHLPSLLTLRTRGRGRRAARPTRRRGEPGGGSTRGGRASGRRPRSPRRRRARARE